MDKCYHKVELGTLDVKWKKSVTKDHILYDSIYIKYSE